VVPQVGRCWNVVALLVVIPFQNITEKKHICWNVGSRFYPSRSGQIGEAERFVWGHPTGPFTVFNPLPEIRLNHYGSVIEGN
jgi:hypothetical protein